MVNKQQDEPPTKGTGFVSVNMKVALEVRGELVKDATSCREDISRLASGSGTMREARSKQSSDAIPSPERLFPYVVPAEYLQHQQEQPSGLVRPLGHGLHVVLVLELNGLLRNLLQADLSALAISPEEAYARAITNLDRVARSGAVGQSMFPNGPQGRPFIVSGGHWTAATCILLPRLMEKASKALNSNELYISIPHRDAMLVFPKADESYRKAMIEMIRAGKRRSQTADLFSL